MPEVDGPDATILVVDDTDALRALLTVALGTAGFRPIEAPDGRTAIEMAGRTPPDVVLLDLVLPDIHGLDVLDQLKADPRTANAPVVVVTARNDSDLAEETLRRGAHDLVVKPFRMAELLARVEAAVRVKREHDQLFTARAALRAQVDFAEAIMDTIDTLVVVLDRAGRIVRFNQAAERVSGYQESELAGQPIWETPLLGEEARSRTRHAFTRRVEGNPPIPLRRFEGRWRTRSGGVRVISWSNTSLLDAEGKVEFGVATGIDITDLRHADERLHACLDVMPGSIFILEAIRGLGGEIIDFQTRFLNRGAQEMIPARTLKAAMESGSLQFMTAGQFETVCEVITTGVTIDGETDVSLEGRMYTMAFSAAPLGDGAVVSLRDVTHRRATEEKLAWAATHDPLTGLASRTLLVDRLQHALSRRRREPETVVAVLFVDLDGFKAVNDGLGHAAGDDALVRVSRALEATVRPEDTVARYGGDEFVVVAEGLASPDEAGRLAERLAGAVAQVSVPGHPLRASVGYALAQTDDNPDAILRVADDMMYEKKRRSR